MALAIPMTLSLIEITDILISYFSSCIYMNIFSPICFEIMVVIVLLLDLVV